MQASGLRHWIQQHVSWPLALALVLSLLLHITVLTELNWRNWLEEAPQQTVLQARLSPPPIAQAVAAAPPSKPRPIGVKPASTLDKTPSVQPESPAESTEVIAEQASALPAAAEQVATTEEEGQAKLAEIAAWHEMDQPVAVADDEKPPPYQRVSTAFVVYVNGEDRPAGTASIDYVQESPGNYSLRWLVEGRGLLKLLYPSLEQQSTGEVGPSGLKPHFYRYAFGSRASKTYEASFDWETNVITLKTAKGEQRRDLRVNTQDILSFMYQFMFVPPLQEMHVTLTNGRRVGEYEYSFEGEDSLVIADQTIQTVHIVHTRGDTDEKVELWLASDYRYVPVKIKKLEKNGMVIEQVATRLITE
ncbi:DUF3108 domain-containing protein [Methylophilus sp.]|uniref:DUF3108 domain-containing protein n=1 Tax=Methylophilus sp. TaxID=29541 RepID=UPI0011D39024|nr:DUF3108 domain-containing protein [Methylophilus sp.]TXI43465.1 MAG: DUF3108 domain-containing protein [Methylophilus sp.]